MPEVSPLAPQPLVVSTDAGTVVGTPEYLSPEAATAKPLDQRADLYAAGLVLYRMVAGRGPFDHAPTEAKLLAAQANEEPAPPSRFAREPVPPDVDDAILRALRKSPDERFQTADEMRAELERLLSVLPESPRRRSSPPQEGKERELEREAHAKAEIDVDDLAAAGLPVRRKMSNMWLFVAAAVITATATAAIVALLVGAR